MKAIKQWQKEDDKDDKPQTKKSTDKTPIKEFTEALSNTTT